MDTVVTDPLPPKPVSTPRVKEGRFEDITPLPNAPPTPGSRLARWKAKRKMDQQKMLENNSFDETFHGGSGYTQPATKEDTSEKKNADRWPESSLIRNKDQDKNINKLRKESGKTKDEPEDDNARIKYKKKPRQPKKKKS